MIRYSANNGIARIGIDSEYNALDLATLDELMKILNRLKDDSDIRAVIFQGERGRFFCTGAFLPEIKYFNTESGYNNFCLLFIGIIKKIIALPQLTIAKVRGKSVGSGVAISCACDKSIGLKNCSFKMSEIIFGFDPMIVVDPLIKKMGVAHAQSMVFSPKRFFGSRWALESNLLDAVFLTENELETAVVAAAEDVKHYNPVAVAQWKETNPFIITRPGTKDRAKKTAKIMAKYAARLEMETAETTSA